MATHEGHGARIEFVGGASGDPLPDAAVVLPISDGGDNAFLRSFAENGGGHIGIGGRIYSGSIGMFQLSSGAIVSGAFQGTPYVRRCGVCKTEIDYAPHVELIRINAPYGTHQICAKCAGYNLEKKRFETREDWIRESLHFAPDAPWWAMADWLEEHDRYKDAEYLRLKYAEKEQP